MQIAILGGSFNPVHNAHVAMARYALVQDWADQVMVIPCWQHPFGRELAPYEDRLAMCRLAFDRVEGIEVSDIERDLAGVSYTAQTVRALQKLHPDGDFAVLVGADAAADMHRWREHEWLIEHAALMTIPRGTDSPIPDISATNIRATHAAGGPIHRMVPPGVAEYIEEHGVYEA